MSNFMAATFIRLAQAHTAALQRQAEILTKCDTSYPFTTPTNKQQCNGHATAPIGLGARNSWLREIRTPAELRPANQSRSHFVFSELAQSSWTLRSELGLGSGGQAPCLPWTLSKFLDLFRLLPPGPERTPVLNF